MALPVIVKKIEEISGLPEEDLELLKKVEDKYPFLSNEYYLSLIDWEDENDPIRRIIIPDLHELDPRGDLDPSGESEITVVRGIQHKYGPTALMIVSESCGGVCRYCFRKRIFLDTESETIDDFPEAMDYIKSNPKISNVLLTGGDPLFLATVKLQHIISKLREIPHVKIIRIGSRMPAFNPRRILDDPSLLEMIKKYSTKDKRIYIMTHFSHPRELTDLAVDAAASLLSAGAILANQTPILRGVNDNPDVLSELFTKLAETGIPPYYVFQCRPTIGNSHFSVPIEETYEILRQAREKCSGLAKRAKFIMSHKTGKIEILAVDENFTYMKYHQAADIADNERFMVFKKNPKGYWLEDYGGSFLKS
ncbi:MAG: KamA family radical SAM protein [Methanomicrobiaceae archaeon]|nr:KamA family radical SAM protein [Methanomicrobiaceae archaeon]